MSGHLAEEGDTARTLTERLANHLAQPVSGTERARARLHLLDWLACVAGARTSPLAQVGREAEPDVLTRAALLGNLLEMDDVDRLARLHPGPVVWPAALSAARDERASLGALLDGAVRGYEAMVRVGRSLDDHHYRHWHPTATAGGFGAAAAAASVYGMDEERAVWAMGHAGSLAGGLWQVRHEPAAMTKSVHVTQAALAGLWHARLARRGCAGPRAILEGPQGLFAAATRAPRPEAIAAPAPGWRMAEVSFKPWAACRHAHPAIDAALLLPDGALAQGPILVETYGDALSFCDRPEPKTAGEAKFSLQHALAVVAVRGRPTISDFSPDAVADPMIAAARARVSLACDPALDAAYPAHFGARVGAGGATAEARDAWGDPENPLGEGGLVGKLESLMAWGGLPPRAAADTCRLVLASPDDTPAADLVEHLAGWLA
ncbi:MAG: MmgE/PrpD family protein [Thermaurantiacus sp.]